MDFTKHKKKIVIWTLISLAILYCLFLIGTNASASANRLALRNASDTLILLVELATESGDRYIQAKTLFAELLQAYAVHMEQRELYGLLQLPFSKKNIAKELKRVSQDLKDTAHINNRKSIDEARDSIVKFLIKSKPFTDESIIIFEPEDISEEIQKAIKDSLSEAHEKVERYIKDPNLDSSQVACMANRKAIAYLYLARFNYQVIVDEETLERFRTDINLTVYYNQLLQQTEPIKAGKEMKDSDYELLGKYSDSERRRLWLLHAIIDNDIQRAQILLQIALIEAIPDIQFLAVTR